MYGGRNNKDTVSYILHLYRACSWVIVFIPGEKARSNQCIEGWVGLVVVLDPGKEYRSSSSQEGIYSIILANTKILNFLSSIIFMKYLITFIEER
jgi:RNA polymerase subunit RPABC4/transcription elongation factor Spt4